MAELQSRIRYVDFLKTLGLMLIMLAHVKCPDLLLAIRCFDVPLMVILSGFLANSSFNRRYPDGKCGARYFWTRFKRLVFPTWIFLVIYFVIQALAGFHATFQFYLASFALTRYGVGYVWIILIYLFTALLIPFIHKLSQHKLWFVWILGACLLDEVLYQLGVGVDNLLLLNTFYYIIPYGLMTALGYNYGRMNLRHKLIVIFTALFTTVGFGIYYYLQSSELQPFQIVKYPPQFYFTGYGVFASFLLLLFCEKVNLKIYKNRVVEFISKHSLWIYLWHILFITTLNHTFIKNYWWLELIIVISTSLFTVWVQNKIVEKIEKKKPLKFLAYFKG